MIGELEKLTQLRNDQQSVLLLHSWYDYHTLQHANGIYHWVYTVCSKCT